MTDVSPISRPAAPTLAPGAHARGASASSEAPTRGSDRVELSAASQYFAKLAALPEVRMDLVNRVKQQIKADTYETSEKVDGAIDGLGEDLKG